MAHKPRRSGLPSRSNLSWVSWAINPIGFITGALLTAIPAYASTPQVSVIQSVAQYNPLTSTPSAPITTPPNTTSGDTPDATTITTPPADARFSCESDSGEYTVMYRPQSQPGQAYAWAQPTALGGGWSADRRCAEISRRLEYYRPDGLVEMRTSTENGYNIICVTTEADPNCRIVLTVPPGQDPIVTRDRVFANLTVADGGQQTQAVTTYAGEGGSDLLNQIGNAIGIDLSPMTGSRNSDRNSRSGAINLRPFLDPADGGTGERL